MCGSITCSVHICIGCVGCNKILFSNKQAAAIGTEAGAAADTAVRVIQQSGERYFPAPASPEFGGVSTPIRESRLDELGLSARERDVLSLLVAGHPNKDIARALSIATVTVSYHLTQIYRKLGVGSRTEAVRIAFERGLVSDRRG